MFRFRLPAPVVLTAGILALIAVGTLLLALPFANVRGEWTPLLTALFTATSAASVTGLVLVDTASYWSPFGQVVILALIQIGGLGFMTGATLLFVLFGRRITLQERLAVQQSLGTEGMGSVAPLVRRIVRTVFALEAIGAVLLTLHFLGSYEPLEAIWRGTFYSVSAFNNAGFDLTGGFASFTPYRHDWFVLAVAGGLILLGSISYTVMEDLWRMRSFRRATLDTELVLVVTALLLVLGAVVFFFGERNNPATFGRLGLGDQIVNALFMSISGRTAGFSVVEVSQLHEFTRFAVSVLMFIGGASGSTAGGIKVNTLSLLLVATYSAVAGRREVEVFKRRVPDQQVQRALAIAIMSGLAVVFVAFWLAAVERTSFLNLWFEAISAFGTAGLSTGITPGLTDASKVLLVCTMFVGRLGPLTLALMLARTRPHRVTWAQEWVKIG